jgi:hypothetical protein
MNLTLQQAAGYRGRFDAQSVGSADYFHLGLHPCCKQQGIRPKAINFQTPANHAGVFIIDIYQILC